MNSIDITEILESFNKTVDSHKICDGKYTRFTGVTKENASEVQPNAYGCADAANILYSINRFPKEETERKAFVTALQAMQNKESGYFVEGSHHVIHTTAHCTAALELFDALPLYPFYDMEKYLDAETFRYYIAEEYDFLRCGKSAHAGAGIYAAFSITGKASREWKNAYFNFLDSTCNPESGLWEKNPIPEYTRRFQIGDSFHYYFNYGDAHKKIPYPEALIDSCLNAYNGNMFENEFGKQFHFIEMDWIYCLNRASWQTTHRFDEIKSTLCSFAKSYTEYLKNVNYKEDKNANDLHLVFGVTCALAELQKALPGIVTSDIPTRLVLDRRPFI